MSVTRYGIWIDNAEAIVVRFLDDGEAQVHRIDSGVTPRSKTRGGMRAGRGKVSGASHSKPEQKRLNQLSHFYDEVWRIIRDAGQIAILGPGVARKGLESEVREHQGHPEIVAAEPDQRHTDPQLVARFRKIFEPSTN